MGIKRGEEVWQSYDGDYPIHLPIPYNPLESEDDFYPIPSRHPQLFYVHGRECVRALDGGLEFVTTF